MKWIVSEYAQSLEDSPSKFAKLTGISWWDFNSILDDLDAATDKDVKRLMEKYKEQFANPWLAGFIKALPKLGRGAKDDMHELYQWGYVEGKGVVVVDYGFDKKIQHKYYEEEE